MKTEELAEEKRTIKEGRPGCRLSKEKAISDAGHCLSALPFNGDLEMGLY